MAFQKGKALQYCYLKVHRAACNNSISITMVFEELAAEGCF